VKSILLAAALLAFAAAPLSDPMARFSYSTALAERMNARLGNAADTMFVSDDAQGRELSRPLLLSAIQALIRVFPACGNRQLRFGYAYGQDATAHLVAFEEEGASATKCPPALVTIAPDSGAVTVRSFPQT
jgi:hypothetical protein